MDNLMQSIISTSGAFCLWQDWPTQFPYNGVIGALHHCLCVPRAVAPPLLNPQRLLGISMASLAEELHCLTCDQKGLRASASALLSDTHPQLQQKEKHLVHDEQILADWQFFKEHFNCLFGGLVEIEIRLGRSYSGPPDASKEAHMITRYLHPVLPWLIIVMSNRNPS